MLVLGKHGRTRNACYTNAAINKTTPTCSGDPLPSAAAKQAVAPFLYNGGLTPTLNDRRRQPRHLLLRHLNQVSP